MAIKRAFDIIVSALALIVLSPLICLAMLLIWAQDGRSPIFAGQRVGERGVMFRCLKLRTMVVGADRTKVDTTIRDDPRITQIGHILRRYKLDELPQFWNVLIGEMSIVGPRPNVARETELYTQEERRMLALQPGITDFSSIVFSDLGEILGASKDPNLDYNQLVRPWKSRLILHYLDHRSIAIDLALIALTVVSIVSASAARRGVASLLEATGADPQVVAIARRAVPLAPMSPPGSSKVVTQR